MHVNWTLVHSKNITRFGDNATCLGRETNGEVRI